MFEYSIFGVDAKKRKSEKGGETTITSAISRSTIE